MNMEALNAYRTTRRLIGIVLLLLVLAFAKYFEVQRKVDGSPYWATDPKTARQMGTHVADAGFEKKGSSLRDAEPRLLSVWLERSYSYSRTGLFSCKVVVNQEQRVRALFEGTTLVRPGNGAWSLEVDGQAQEAALASGGAIVDGFEGGAETSHRIRVVASSGEAAEWTILFDGLHAR